ncbi:G-type lectin S-receptor-like serine/threonine-protein kinase RLK1 [Apostasia shenzhenica]|uniref:Receptor-like serine/threonine-protein kinase n=1 Tax=Apostasia shenzhenica TaxID=1088818 RepID=A0A2I0ACE4_9ASPA|nr:G-type lectin S-receptor-like serine/threonine-protein kinase RLK1 [Apostasia shenzhenica]
MLFFGGSGLPQYNSGRHPLPPPPADALELALRRLRLRIPPPGIRPSSSSPSVVWFAGAAAAAATTFRNGSAARLSPGGQLALLDDAGQEVWSTGGAGNATSVAILDSGDLVLTDAGGGVTWKSFDQPTDTILPSQTLTSPAQLFSRLTDDDYTRGRFELALEDNGDLAFYPLAFPTPEKYDSYWNSSTAGSGARLVFNNSGAGADSVFLALKNGSTVSVTSPTIQVPQSNYYQRATLDPDGVFRHYFFSRDDYGGGWKAAVSLPSNPCDRIFTTVGSGACGFNSYCTLGAESRVDCRCPPHYSFFDPSKKHAGCKPDFPLPLCDPTGDETNYSLEPLPNVDWPLADADRFSPMNESDCADYCLSHCLCLAAVYKSDTCYIKKWPLSNGRLSGNLALTVYIKYSDQSSDRAAPCSGDRRKTWVIVGFTLLAASVLLNLLQLAKPSPAKSLPATTLRPFTYKELEEATGGFRKKLGRGAFGTVYKGMLPSDPAIAVAVKRLETMLGEAEKDFENEVQSIGQTHHRNLVRLYGFCKEGSHRLLVYEFMSNGALNSILFSPQRPAWRRRVEIAAGIAAGISYLHEECRTQIIHCDIKPQNILLDENYGAKISDFGLAKLLKMEQTRTSTGIRGTVGYFAPEWFRGGAVTAKVDVYSFGVVMLEIISCRKNLLWEEGDEEKAIMAEWARDCLRERRADRFVDGEEEAVGDGGRLERMMMVALACVEENPAMRPAMKTVAQMLDREVATPADVTSFDYEDLPNCNKKALSNYQQPTLRKTNCSTLNISCKLQAVRTVRSQHASLAKTSPPLHFAIAGPAIHYRHRPSSHLSLSLSVFFSFLCVAHSLSSLSPQYLRPPPSSCFPDVTRGISRVRCSIIPSSLSP